MALIDGESLFFRFRELGENAKLAITFRLAEAPQGVARLVPSATGDGFMFEALGRVSLHLTSELPFAVLATIEGKNVLTGDDRASSLLRPQNYFATPPQRVIEGYFDGQQFQPFYACGIESDNRMPLLLKVFPMKATELAWFENESKKCGYNPRGWGTTFILDSQACGGEPIFEDTRCLGDWDQNSVDEAIIWLHQPNVYDGTYSGATAPSITNDDA